MSVTLAARHRTGARLMGATLFGVCAFGLWQQTTANAQVAPRSATAVTTGSAMALRFEPNVGQLEEEVRYLARGQGYGLFLTRDGATLSLFAAGTGATEHSVVSMRLVGARPVEPMGVAQLQGHSNYFVGNSRVSDVPSFGRVRYAEVLPGVDLDYYATAARELEYDLTLAPHVDASALAMHIEGISSLEIDARGDAVLALADGSTLRKRRPVAYQLDATGGRRFVSASFRKLAEGRLGFVLGAYDSSRPLVIDPVLNYSSYLGGSRFDEFFAVGADAAGNTYAVGYTTGTLFPTHAAAQATYGGGASDAVIVKLNAGGNNFVFATYLGGSDTDRAYGVAVDAAGSSYVTGLTYSSNFPTAGAPLQATHGGGQDAFVAKLGPTGVLVYSTYLGGSGDDLGQGIAVRSTGEAYVAGTTFSANFPKLGALQGSLGGTNDAFVSKLSAAGNSLVYSTFLGGTGAEYGQAIAVDNAGSAYVVGQTGSGNFPVLSALQSSFGGAVSDGFVSKLSATGSALAYSTYLGGSSADVATGVTQLGGAALVVGYTSSFNFPTSSAAQPTLGGNSDAFVTRVSATGAGLDFSTYLGGSSADSAAGVVLDAQSFVYVTGQTASSNFPVESPFAGTVASAGGADAFLAAFTSGGSRVYSSYLGGSGADAGVGVTTGPPNLLHVLGNTFSSNFPTQSPLFAAPLGPQDGFVARLTTLTLTPAPWGRPTTLALLTGLLFGAALLSLSRPTATRT